MAADLTVEQMVKVINHAIEDKLGRDILILNIGKITSLADYFIITTASSSRQVKAIADKVEEDMTKNGLEPRGKEGIDSQQWVLLDYGDIMVQASSSRQVKAIADKVEEDMTKNGLEPRGKEGIDSQQWVLLDYGDIMVHIFDEENRDFYNLEKLWKDAPVVDPDEL